MRRAFVVMRRVLLQIAHDKRTLALILIQPLVIMAVFGFAFGGDVSDAKVAIANLDRGTLGEAVIAELDLSVVIVIRVDTAAAAENALRAGTASMGVVFPLNFTRNLESATSGQAQSAYLSLYKDNTNPQVTGAIQSELADALGRALEKKFDREGAFVFDEHIVFGGDEAKSLEFFLPGIAAFSIFQLGSLLTVVTIVKERSVGTLPRLLASPVTRQEVVIGYASGFGLFSIVQALSVLFIGIFVFGARVQGSFFLALFITTLVGLVALGFGILVSGTATNEFQATQAVFLLSFPNLFLAGIFAPLEAMPHFLRPVAAFLPLTYAVQALRDTLNHGATFDDVFISILILTAFGVATLIAATFSFGRRT